MTAFFRCLTFATIISRFFFLSALIEVPSRMQIIDCKNPIFHPITGEELSRRINGVEKLRSCGTMCKYLMIGTGGGSAHHPSRADARYVMDKLKEDVSCTQTAIYSSFTLITEGETVGVSVCNYN